MLVIIVYFKKTKLPYSLQRKGAAPERIDSTSVSDNGWGCTIRSSEGLSKLDQSCKEACIFESICVHSLQQSSGRRTVSKDDHAMYESTE